MLDGGALDDGGPKQAAVEWPWLDLSPCHEGAVCSDPASGDLCLCPEEAPVCAAASATCVPCPVRHEDDEGYWYESARHVQGGKYLCAPQGELVEACDARACVLEGSECQYRPGSTFNQCVPRKSCDEEAAFTLRLSDGAPIIYRAQASYNGSGLDGDEIQVAVFIDVPPAVLSARNPVLRLSVDGQTTLTLTSYITLTAADFGSVLRGTAIVPAGSYHRFAVQLEYEGDERSNVVCLGAAEAPA